MVPCPASDLLKTAWINLPRAGVVLTVWIAIRTGEHILGRQQNRSDLCFNANMIGRKALHHVYLMADNTASPWLVFGSRLFRAFPWGSSERALISEKKQDYAESVSEQACHGSADESGNVPRSSDCDPCYSEFSCQRKVLPKLIEGRRPGAA